METHRASAPALVLPPNRSFGILFCLVFAIVAVWPLFSGNGLRMWAVGVSIVFAILAIAAPNLLTPLNRAWMQFGALLHRIVSPIVLAVLFFVVITPFGLVMRVMKRDPLRLSRHEDRSYWVDRMPPGPRPDSLDKQF